MEEEPSQASQQGWEAAGRPPRHGNAPFALAQRGPLAPPFAAAAASAAARARLLALKRSAGSPPCHRNRFLEACQEAPASPSQEAALDGPGSACASRFRCDFRQLRTLGRGAFSHVFEVQSRLDGGRYALKRSSRALTTRLLQVGALAEVQALAACGSHASLVRYHGAWFEQERLHTVLELCGPSLAQRVHAGQPLLQPDLAALLRCVASALAHLHACGVAHCDVKPDNIFLATQAAAPDGSGACSYKLGDLGAACRLHGGCGGGGGGEGDGRYVALEVLSGFSGALDRADVWALGASALELATARPLPLSGESYAQLRRGVVPDITGLSTQLAALLRRCLHEFPAQRPAAAILADSPALRLLA